MSDARQRMIEVVRQALAQEAMCQQTVESLTLHMAETVVEALVQEVATSDSVYDVDGWLIMGGVVRRVQVADRFGPACWEISCDPGAPDWKSWRK